MAEPGSLPSLLEDLHLEHAALDGLVAQLDEASWALPTPAAGWAIRDQISHLAFFDDAATMAVTEPARFTAMAEAALAAPGDPMEEHLRRGRAMSGAEVLAWWRRARHAMTDATGTLDDRARIPWFGPPMGALSFVSARLMETWAHGHDVADALGARPEPTERLRHIAHLGVRARPFSFIVRGLDPPAAPVRVALRGPSGQQWEWDAAQDTTDVVEGSALDFCLVVTQRRHVSDTDLEVAGDGARQWMAIAQAFAGGPGPGRPPRHGDQRS
ncbi:MAG: TIGR03084 family metal-binding protein [Acidimicrobiales bacterium]|jgi:uncharacterized protein (TIGR03084 family)